MVVKGVRPKVAGLNDKILLPLGAGEGIRAVGMIGAGGAGIASRLDGNELAGSGKLSFDMPRHPPLDPRILPCACQTRRGNRLTCSTPR